MTKTSLPLVSTHDEVAMDISSPSTMPVQDNLDVPPLPDHHNAVGAADKAELAVLKAAWDNASEAVRQQFIATVLQQDSHGIGWRGADEMARQQAPADDSR